MEAGPEIPPHILAKRKRKAEEAAAAAAAAAKSKVKAQSTSSNEERIIAQKRARVSGPAPPPAVLDERPDYPTEYSETESSDDEIGPSLPSGLAPEVSFLSQPQLIGPCILTRPRKKNVRHDCD